MQYGEQGPAPRAPNGAGQGTMYGPRSGRLGFTAETIRNWAAGRAANLTRAAGTKALPIPSHQHVDTDHHGILPSPTL